MWLNGIVTAAEITTFSSNLLNAVWMTRPGPMTVPHDVIAWQQAAGESSSPGRLVSRVFGRRVIRVVISFLDRLTRPFCWSDCRARGVRHSQIHLEHRHQRQQPEHTSQTHVA